MTGHTFRDWLARCSRLRITRCHCPRWRLWGQHSTLAMYVGWKGALAMARLIRMKGRRE